MVRWKQNHCNTLCIQPPGYRLSDVVTGGGGETASDPQQHCFPNMGSHYKPFTAHAHRVMCWAIRVVA